jgi:hypothetical protein
LNTLRNDFFKNFGKEVQIGNGAVVVEIVKRERGLFEKRCNMGYL